MTITPENELMDDGEFPRFFSVSLATQRIRCLPGGGQHNYSECYAKALVDATKRLSLKIGPRQARAQRRAFEANCSTLLEV